MWPNEPCIELENLFDSVTDFIEQLLPTLSLNKPIHSHSESSGLKLEKHFFVPTFIRSNKK